MDSLTLTTLFPWIGFQILVETEFALGFPVHASDKSVERRNECGQFRNIIKPWLLINSPPTTATKAPIRPVLFFGGFEWGWRAEAKSFAHQPLRLLRRSRFRHGDVASTEAVWVEVSQGSSSQLWAGHRDKSVSARFLSCWIEHQLDADNSADPRKEGLQFGFCHRGRQIPDV